jgi:hypothetical protein
MQMKDSKSEVRICSSGPLEEDLDDLEAYSTAYIRRFCETLGQIVNRNEEARKKEKIRT